MRQVYLLLVGLLFLVSSTITFAQPSKGGLPLSFSDATITSDFEAINVPSINVDQVIAEDAQKGIILWVGRTIPLDYDMSNAGTWTILPNGTKIWRLKLSSLGAKALGVTYSDFYIPEGGKLYIYNDNKNQVIGAFTSENNPDQRVFSTELIQGEALTLEYIAPKTIKQKPDNNNFGKFLGDKFVPSNQLSINKDIPSISISGLIYVYRDVPHLAKYDPTKDTGFGASNECQVNVNCSPEGDNWQVEKRSVAEMFILGGGGWGWCTGALINTTNNSGTPYFLTADHCHGMPDAGSAYSTPTEMNQWQFYFNYESSGCVTGTEPTYNTMIGCALKSYSPINGGSDFCLVQLNTTPPQANHPYYNGWDRTNTASTSGVGIHHPQGDIKKISTFTSTLTTGTFNGGTGAVGATNAFWVGTYAQTANGYSQTEGGSSGSPLFNSSKRQVGTLTGGTEANCATGSSFDYGKIYNHWDLMGTLDNQRLKPWLDPVTSGSTTVNGYDPYSGYPDFYGVPTTIYANSSVNFTDITDGATSWLWQFEGGSPATSTAQTPPGVTYYQQGTYRVSLTTTTPLAGTQTQEKVGYITVLPGAPNETIWCDDFTTAANWTIVSHVPNTQLWAVTSAAPIGYYSAGNPGKINSTSGGNYALFDSDGLTSTNVDQWSSITNANGVDCGAYPQVFLKFQQAYTKYYDSTLVYVSTDNFTTSTRYVVNGNYANNDGSPNPDNVQIDITGAAASQTNVKVRFTFRSTLNMDGAPGWGYAWGIDDVCLEGVLAENILPQANFTVNSRNVQQGGSVNFTDLSNYATSYEWTFEGGTPSTSTAQNPTNIAYNTQGDYAVTLKAINENGYVVETKTEYIHVFYDCRFTGNLLDDDNVTYYYKPSPATMGYVPGHATVGGANITAYADKITLPAGMGTGKVKSLAVAVGNADVVGGTTNVTFCVWSDNAGQPGTVLTSRIMAVKDLQAGYINYVNFAPASVGTTFWVGFQLNYVASLDTFACYWAYGGEGKTNTTSYYNGTSWTSVQTTFNKIGSLYILPEYCKDKPAGSKPDADFYADNTEIAPGTSVNFTDQSTGATPTSWSWAFSGGSPASSTTQNQSNVSYASAGLYDVTHNSTNANGTDIETKASYIHVAPTTNVVFWNFPNVTDNAIADGGITANLTATITNWGYVASTGAPNPSTQNYTVTGASTRCAGVENWNDANANPTTAWSVTFTTLGYTNIKLSSKQMGNNNASPQNFAIYYSVNGGSFSWLKDVPPLTTVSSWTQGVVSNVQLPAECDNAESIEIVWYKTSEVSVNGGAVADGAYSFIDDILITGQQCNTLPSAAGTISGSATPCQGSTGNVYTVPTITGATYYVWDVPTGATITAGEYTNSITVSFATDQAAGNVSVYGANMCGDGTGSTKALTFSAVPARPGPITGLQEVFGGQTGVAYSVPDVSGATSYTWTMPSFGTITAGATTRNMTASFSCPGTMGNISVHANNACGASFESYTHSVVIACDVPVADFIADQTSVVTGSTVNFTDLSTNFPSTWSWTLDGGTPSSSTVKNPSVVYNTPGTYTVSLTASNGIGGDSETKTGYITVSSAPEAIVYWDFPLTNDNATADGGIAANLTKIITGEGGVSALTFATAGASTRCASATTWGTGSGLKFYQVEFTTLGYQTIKVSSKMTGDDLRSPRDFKLQYKIGVSGTWTDVTGATNITLANSNWLFATANLADIELPSECSDVASVYLRWIMRTNTAISGISNIQAGKACLIDDIIVMGVPMPTFPPVANFSGTPTSVCAGSTVAFTDLSTNSPASWAWSFSGGTPTTSTAQNPTVTYNTPGTYDVSLTVTNANGNDAEIKTGYITVNAASAVSVSIAANPSGAICTGNSVTFTATPTNGGTTPSYQWKLNSGNVGTGGTTYTSTTLANGDAVTCVLTSNIACPTGNPATSNTITMSVNTVPAQPGTISGSTTPCVGSSQTYSVTNVSGVTYTWALPTGWTGTSTTNSITVTVGTGSGNISVTPSNSCGNGTARTLAVTVNNVPAQPGTISGSTTPCVGSSQIYSVTNVGGVTYAWTLPTGWTGTSATNSITVTVGTGTGDITVTPSNTCGAGTARTLAVTVTNVPAQPSTIAGSTTPCQGSSQTYSVTNVTGVTYTWALPTGWTGTSTTNSITVTVGSGFGNITVTPSNTCGNGTAQTLAVTVNTVPAQPSTITGSTTPCVGSTQIYSVTNVVGVTYAWTLPAGWSGTSTTNSITVTVGAGSGNVSVTPSNTCGNGVARTLAVTVANVPAQPSTITGSTNPCIGSTQIYSVTNVVGVSYTWALPTGWSGTSTTNSITVTVGSGTGNISVTPSNTCGTGTARTLAVTVSDVPAQPTAITGSTSPCQGSTQTYSVTNVSGVTYTWTLPTAWTGTSTTNSITVTVGSGSGNITVTPSNTCGDGTAQTLAVTVGTVPAQPSAITGSTTPCVGSSQTYSVTNVSGVAYAWTLPAGWSGSSTTNSITVTVGAGSGNISVTPSNTCGNGTAQTLAVTTTTVPAQPSIITGSATPCLGSSQTYSVTNVAGVTYSWALPTGWTGTSTTNSITVTVGSGSGNISVTPSNTCGTGTARTLAVTVSDVPAQPSAITGSTTPCQSSTQSYSVTIVSGVTYNWALPTGWTGTSTTNSITVTVGSGSGNISVTPSNTCGNGTAQTLAVTVGTVPAQPSTITGNTTPCAGSTQTYSVTNVSGVTYAWTLPAGWSGTSSTNSITVTVGATSGNITVTPSNSCGNGTAQSLAITVSDVPAQPSAITGSTSPCLGSTQTYSVTNVAGVTYTWALPTGWTGTSTFNSITVTVGSGNGNISVTPSNTCGNGIVRTLAVTVSDVPAQPSVISGSAAICQGSTQTYSVTNVSGVTYTWTLPAGWAGTSTTNSITATAGSTSGSISVTPSNTCGDGTAQTLAVTVSPLSVGGSISGGTAICLGASTGTLTLSGNTGAIVKWQKRVDGGSWTDIVNTNTTYSELPASAGTWDYRAEIQSGSCSSVYSSAAVVVVSPITAAGAVTGGSTPIVEGSSTGTMTLSGQTGAVIKWQRRLDGGTWEDIVNTNLTYSEAPSPAGTWDFRAVVQSGSCALEYSTFNTIVVIPASGGSITGGTTPLCLGSTTGTMTLSGYTGTIVRWESRVDGGSWNTITNTLATYSETPATVGTWEYRAYTDNSGVFTYSGSRTIVVNPLTVGGTISGASDICDGSNTGVLTLSGNVGSVIKWQKRLDGGTWNDIVNTSASYSEIPAFAGTWDYRAEIKSGACATDYSTNATVVVSPATVAGSVTGGSTICLGASTATLTLAGYTGNVIKWQNRVDAGSWVDITNTNTTYSETPATSGVWEYRAVIQSGTCTEVYSNATVVTVNPATVGGTVSGDAAICLNDQTGTLTLTGYTGSVIKWQKRLDGGAWNDIANTNDTYIETPSSEGTWEYRTQVQSGVCGAEFSAVATVVVSPVTVSGTLNGGGTICLSSSTGTITLTGYTGLINKWQKRVDGGSWTDIVNTTNSYEETPTTAGTWDYRAEVQSGTCAVAYSTTITVIVSPAASAGSVSGSATICINEGTGTLTLSGNSGAIIKWQKRVDAGVWIDIANTNTTYSETPVSAGSWEYHAAIDGGGCGMIYSTSATIVVNPLPEAAGIITGTAEVCQGTTGITFSVNPIVNATGYTWTLPIGASVVSGNNTNSITVDFATNAVSGNITVEGVNTCGTGTVSSNYVITVNPIPTVVANATETTVCEGTLVALTGSGANSYTWDHSVTDGVSFAATATTIYTVTGTLNGCTNTDQITVNVNPLPTVTANTTASTVCEGTDITLTGGGAVSYVWNNSVSNGVAFTPVSTLTYTVTGTDANTCSNTAQLTVTVNPLPNVIANASETTICAGTSVTLTGSGAVSYTWDNSVANGVAFAPSATTTFTVTGTDGNTCSNTAQVTVNVNPLPTVTANTTANAVCAGASVTLTGGGAVSYIWNNSVTDAVAFVPTITKTYTVTGTDANNCTNTAQVTVTVNQLPVVTANTSASAVCSGSSVILTGGGAVSYVWNNSILDGIAFTPSSTATYTVTGTDVNTCTNTANVNVTVNSLPVITANASATTVCAGTSVILTGGGATSYVWDNSVTNGVAFTPSATATYTVTGTDVNTCTNTAQVTVNVNPAVIVNTGTDQSITFGSTTTLNGSASGGSGNYTYSWTPSTSLVDAAVASPVTISLETSTVFTLVVTDANTNCTGTNNVTIIVTGGPLSGTATASSTVICEGISVTLGVVPSGGTGSYTYSWTSVPAGFTSSDVNPVVTPTENTVYYCEIYDGNTTVTPSVSVTVNPLPEVIANATETIVCAGTQVTLTGGGASTYTWSNSVVDGTAFSPAATATYTVTGTDANSCSNTAQVLVTINALPIVTANANATSICSGTSVTLTGNGANTYLWSGSVANNVAFIPAATATYTVTGTDANLCSNTAQVTVVVNNLPVVDAGSDQNIPYGTSTTLTGIVGAGDYSFSWTPVNLLADATAQNPVTVNLTETSVFTMLVTDNISGCESSDFVTVYITGGPLTATISATPTAICEGASVQLAVVPSGGLGTYNYSWSSDPSGFTSTEINPTVVPLETTTYYVTVGDGAETVVLSETVTVNPNPIADAGDDQVIMQGADATLTATGGYDYTWSTNETTDIITVSPAATTTYYVTVENSAGCSDIDTVLVTVNSAMSVNFNVSNVVCYGESNGSATAVVTGGTAPYTFEWSVTGETSEAVTSLEAGIYNVTVTDNLTFATTASVTITEPDELIPSIDVTQISCNGQNDGSVSASATGGNPPYVFAWSNGSFTETIINLTSGTYDLAVSDQMNCSAGTSVIIVNPDVITISYTSTDETAAGNDGTIDLTVSGGTPGYTFAWSNSNTTEDLSGLAAGTYSVVVTDTNACSATADIIINASSCQMIASINATDISCNGLTDGALDLTVSNSTGTITFNWSNSEATEDISGLSAGSYTVTITDDLCSLILTASVSEPTLLEASAVGTVASCGVNDGTVDLTVNGGTLPYTFVWDNTSTTEDLSTVAAGSYNVTVTDASNCTITTSALVTNANAPVITFAPQDPLCVGSCDGNIFAMASGGTAPYTYTWAYDNHHTAFATNVCAGSYTISVADAAGCVTVETSQINDPMPIIADAVIVNTTCNNTNGSISLTVTGGTGSYTYNWSNTETTPAISTLAEGDYIATISDGNSCSLVDTFSVGVEGAPVLTSNINDASCYTTCNGAAFVMATGGVGPYVYTWTYDGHTGQFASNLCAGAYEVSVQDAAGCIVVENLSISSPTELIASTFVVDESIVGSYDGSITANVIGGVPPYTYVWDAASGNQTEQTATFLTAGTYSVTVTDANLCTVTASDTVNVIVSISSAALSQSYFVYPNPTTGPLTIEVSSMNFTKVTVCDVIGRELFIEENVNNTISLNLKDFRPGVYLISLYTQDKVFMHKIILKD